MSLINELRRRRVFRLAGMYLIGAWLVLQIADVTFQPLGLPGWAMSALIWVVIVGFFVAVALSWRYDIGEGGLVRITPSAADDVIAEPLRRSDYVLLFTGVVAAALGGALAIGHFSAKDEPSFRDFSAGASIAVLPFANRTGSEALDYFGDGVAEEVANHLSLLEEISVIAYTATFGYSGNAADPRQVGEDLGVDFVVIGSIRSDGDLLRVSAQLVEAESRVQFWSVNSGPVSRMDAFAVQDAISSGVAGAMASKLNLEVANLPDLTSSEPDAAAYDLYLKGRSIWFRRGSADIGDAVAYFSEAVRIDPEFARAWAALASAYLTWPSYSPAGYRTWYEARTAAEKALSIEPRLAEPYGVLATFEEVDRNWVQAAANLERGLELNSKSSTLTFWYSEHLSKTGRYSESVELLANTIELDPTFAAARIDATFALIMFDEAERAVELFESTWAAGVRSPAIMQSGIISNVVAGNRERTESLIRSTPFPDAQKQVLLDFVAVEFGDAEVLPLIERLDADQSLWPDYRPLAWFAARAGALDFAMRVLEERAANGVGIETRVFWGPGTKLSDHPDFINLVTDVGLADYWEQTRYGDFCSRVDDSLVCETGFASLSDASKQRLLRALN